MLRFANSHFFYLLWLVPVLIVFFVLVFRWKKKALKDFGNVDLIKKLMTGASRGRQIFKLILVITAIVLIVLALVRPQMGTKLEEVQREGVDIFVALDVSYSMLAEDIKPSRLEKAKHEIATFLNKLQGDRIGLIAFAGEAFVQCPLTLDYGAARIFLDIMDPQLIPEPGTAIGDAISMAIKSFEQKERKYKVLILITDGENHSQDPLEVAKEAEKEGIQIFTVGIGTVKGEPIPLRDTQGNLSGFKKDRQGETITSKLDEITLEKIALQTNGKYHRASAGEVELDDIYKEITKMEKKELGSMRFSQFEDRFQYPLGLAIFVLILEVLYPERKRVRQVWRGRFF